MTDICRGPGSNDPEGILRMREMTTHGKIPRARKLDADNIAIGKECDGEHRREVDFIILGSYDQELGKILLAYRIPSGTHLDPRFSHMKVRQYQKVQQNTSRYNGVLRFLVGASIVRYSTLS